MMMMMIIIIIKEKQKVQLWQLRIRQSAQTALREKF
jgi:hypothetical protein